MHSVSHELETIVGMAVQKAQEQGSLPAFELPKVVLKPPRNPEFGDYSTPISKQIARLARMDSDEVAKIIVEHLPKSEIVSSANIADGFINFRLSHQWLQKQIDHILQSGNDLIGSEKSGTAQVECISANPTGPIAVHRIRGGMIGDALNRMLLALGYEVQMEYYYNNAGRQMEVLAASVQARYLEKLGRPSEFPEDGYEGEYIHEIANAFYDVYGDKFIESKDLSPFHQFAEDFISKWQKTTLERLRIQFDSYFNENTLYENEVQETLKALSERGLTYKAKKPFKRDGISDNPNAEELEATATGEAVWLRTMQLRDAPKDVALVRSNNMPTYRLPDIAYHINKFERGFDIMVNVLGSDHLDEARDIKAAIGALGYDNTKLNYIIHQFVKVAQDGKIIEGSTRAGDFLAVDDLIDLVSQQTDESFAIDAIRYFLLAHSPNTEILLDVDVATKRTNENPVFYIQNAHVRCAGIAREAEARGLNQEDGNTNLLSHPSELELILKMIELPDIVEMSAREFAPHKLAFWAHEELAAVFHRVYDEIRAIHSDVPPDLALARLKLYAAAQRVFNYTLQLLGMSAPNQM